MENNITVLVDAKTEYTKQLSGILVPFIQEGINSIYISTERICKMNNDKSILMRFQEQLALIPKWSQNIIDEEFDRIIKGSGCDWLDELMTAVFLSHTKILAAIKSDSKKNKINLKIPKLDHFIHKCYIESAREIWKNPYLFSTINNQNDYQRNVRDSQKIISNSINETIRKLLPVKNILKEYLGSSYEDEDTMLPESYKENLRKLVKKEIEICKGNNINPDIEDKIIDNIQNIDLSEFKESEGNSKFVNNNIEDFNLENFESIELNNEQTKEKDNEIELLEKHSEDKDIKNKLKVVNEESSEKNINELSTNDNIEDLDLDLDLDQELETQNLDLEVLKKDNSKIKKLDLDLETQNLDLEVLKKDNSKIEKLDLDLDLDNLEKINKDNELEIIENNNKTSENSFNEIKEIKNIINNIDKVNLNDTDAELEEINLNKTKENKEIKTNEELNEDAEMSSFELENMNFTKGGLGELNIDTIPDLDFESDYETEKKKNLEVIPTSDIEYLKTTDFNKEKIEPINQVQIETNKNDNYLEESLQNNKNVKTIVIDKEKNNNLKRFTKSKSKNFRFFD